MISKIKVTSWSNKVHPATLIQLKKYSKDELQRYAMGLGLARGRTKGEAIHYLMESGKATICGCLGN